MKKICVLLSVTAILIAFCFYPKVQDIKVCTISSAQYSDDIFALGIVDNQNSTKIQLDFPCIIKKVYCQIGDSVEIGDVLAEIDIDETIKAVSNKISLSLSEEQLGKIPNKILATSKGKITNISVSSGAIVLPNTIAFCISNNKDLIAKIDIDEADIEKVSVGSTVIIKTSANEKRKYLATISKIYPTASKSVVGTTQTTVVTAIATFNQKYSDLREGYNITAAIKEKAPEKIYTIPYDCILQDESGMDFVYVVDGSKIIKTNIVCGKETDEGIEVVSPNLFGKKIVISEVKEANSLVRITE
ncbi:MAG: efflux RND transporter periplasmic adaptor subunit [Oscillospiraceae bacterium]